MTYPGQRPRADVRPHRRSRVIVWLIAVLLAVLLFAPGVSAWLNGGAS